VYYPGPGLAEHAWQRASYGHTSWSLCGITHTTSSAGAMDAITELLTAPVQPWDALICTSRAVKNNVEKLLQAQAHYLRVRLGITKLVLPMLPLIPLGIHTDDFSYTPAQKAAAREKLGADASTLVVLYAGRLSFHGKAHPLAMYQALELAVQGLQDGQKIVLVECGWHANEYISKAFADAATLACPSVRIVRLDGRLVEERQTAWASADVFCSLPDNIQESFGIVPIEAMAAGLPAVVSDWDGYKDTVRDGVDGFRISTLQPTAGFGSDLALRHELEIDTYDRYIGYSSSLVAVDVAACAAAFGRLFASAELRASMGQAGQLRARSMYDWSVIIPQYEALWTLQSEQRKKQAADLVSSPYPRPARMDPFYAFAAYPTNVLTPQTMLALVDVSLDLAQKRLVRYQALTMVSYAKAVLPDAAELDQVLTNAAKGPQSAKALIEDVAPERQALVFRALAWLLKLHILQISH
jgi:starch synthase